MVSPVDISVFGFGVERGPRKGLYLLHKSAEQGHVAAQTMLGIQYSIDYQFQDKRKAVKWFRKPRSKGTHRKKKRQHDSKRLKAVTTNPSD